VNRNCKFLGKNFARTDLTSGSQLGVVMLRSILYHIFRSLGVLLVFYIASSDLFGSSLLVCLQFIYKRGCTVYKYLKTFMKLFVVV